MKVRDSISPSMQPLGEAMDRQALDQLSHAPPQRNIRPLSASPLPLLADAQPLIRAPSAPAKLPSRRTEFPRRIRGLRRAGMAVRAGEHLAPEGRLWDAQIAVPATPSDLSHWHVFHISRSRACQHFNMLRAAFELEMQEGQSRELLLAGCPVPASVVGTLLDAAHGKPWEPGLDTVCDLLAADAYFGGSINPPSVIFSRCMQFLSEYGAAHAVTLWSNAHRGTTAPVMELATHCARCIGDSPNLQAQAAQKLTQQDMQALLASPHLRCSEEAAVALSLAWAQAHASPTQDARATWRALAVHDILDWTAVSAATIQQMALDRFFHVEQLGAITLARLLGTAAARRETPVATCSIDRNRGPQRFAAHVRVPNFHGHTNALAFQVKAAKRQFRLTLQPEQNGHAGFFAVALLSGPSVRLALCLDFGGIQHQESAEPPPLNLQQGQSTTLLRWPQMPPTLLGDDGSLQVQLTATVLSAGPGASALYS